jgi:hypothetical protein
VAMDQTIGAAHLGWTKERADNDGGAVRTKTL